MSVSHPADLAAPRGSWRSSGRRRALRLDRGSAAVEIVLLAPVLVVVLLFVVVAGRAGGTVEQVRHAADQGARAASMARFDGMRAAAVAAVTRDLARNGSACATPIVDVALDALPAAATDAVTVTVTCALNLSGTEALQVAPRSVSASSTEIVDRYRAR